MNTSIAFLSGVGVSLVAVLVAHVLTKRRERGRAVEERRFQIYMRLLDLHASYFWFTTAEMHGEPVQQTVRRRSFELAWQIADLLRAADEMDFLEDILDVTLGPKYPTSRERYDSMGQVLDRLGRRVNPRYAKKIREISEANVTMLAGGRESNAPGSTRNLVP